MINEQSTGVKYDDSKPPISLVDPYFIEGLANVLGFGAKKYSVHNWRNGLNYSRIISAMYRHLGAINKGEDIDPESLHPHVHHLAVNAMFLGEMMRSRPDLDDRFKGTVNDNFNGPSDARSSNSAWAHTVGLLMETQSKQMDLDFTDALRGNSILQSTC